MMVRVQAGPDFEVGDLVRVVEIKDDFTKLRPGDEGVVRDVRRDGVFEGYWVFEVDWVGGEDLAVVTYYGDQIEKVSV